MAHHTFDLDRRKEKIDMQIPIWLLILLILFASLGVWTVIFVMKALGDIIERAAKRVNNKPETVQNDEHRTV